MAPLFLSLLTLLCGALGSGFVSWFVVKKFRRHRLLWSVTLPIFFMLAAWPISLALGPYIFICGSAGECGPTAFVMVMQLAPFASMGGFAGGVIGSFVGQKSRAIGLKGK